MKISLDSFREVSISDRGLLEGILLSRNTMACDYNFANLFCWGGIYDIRWALNAGILLLHSGRDDLFFEPIGDGVSAGDMMSLSTGFRRQGGSGAFSLVTEDFLESRPELRGFFTVTRDSDNDNYVYLSRDLYELKGKKLQRKKNLLSQFRRNNPGYICREMMNGDREECFILAKKWCKEQYCKTVGYTHERSALRRAFDNYDALGLGGLVVDCGGRKAAFSIFSRQRPDTATVHFEKYDRGVKGSSQAVNWETARRLMETYRYINREQDLGIEGLRRAKRSYRPERMVETFTLSRRDTA